MTWGLLLRQLLVDPLAWLFACVVGAATGLAGYAYGHHAAGVANEQHQTKAENVELKKVATEEHAATIEINKVDKAYVEKKTSNEANAAAVNSEFSGLRVKPMCNNSPTVAAGASGTNAAGTAERNRTGEIDFTRLENELIKLGRDYDNAIAKIEGLQDVIVVYQKACGVESP